MHRLVNGTKVEMTLEEETIFVASQRSTRVAPTPSDADVIMSVLKAKNVITEADLTAARKRLTS